MPRRPASAIPSVEEQLASETNESERQRLLQIQSNQARLRELGLGLPAQAESRKAKPRQKRTAEAVQPREVCPRAAKERATVALCSSSAQPPRPAQRRLSRKRFRPGFGVQSAARAWLADMKRPRQLTWQQLFSKKPTLQSTADQAAKLLDEGQVTIEIVQGMSSSAAGVLKNVLAPALPANEVMRELLWSNYLQVFEQLWAPARQHAGTSKRAFPDGASIERCLRDRPWSNLAQLVDFVESVAGSPATPLLPSTVSVSAKGTSRKFPKSAGSHGQTVSSMQLAAARPDDAVPEQRLSDRRIKANVQRTLKGLTKDALNGNEHGRFFNWSKCRLEGTNNFISYGVWLERFEKVGVI